MKLKFQLARKAGAWWIYRRKWFVRLFWLNCILWFWPVYLGHGIYKEVIAPQEVSYAQITKLETSAPVPMPDTIKDTVAYYHSKFGVKVPLEKIYELIECESHGDPNRNGDYQERLLSRGLMQFQPLTFFEQAKLYGIKNADINDWRDQVLIGMMMIRDGKINQWTCWKIIN